MVEHALWMESFLESFLESFDAVCVVSTWLQRTRHRACHHCTHQRAGMRCHTSQGRSAYYDAGADRNNSSHRDAIP
jgi:hypothetical protein